MNQNYAAMVKEKLDKLLVDKFISPSNVALWLSPMVIIPKENGTLCICIDFQKLNTTTIKDHYPLPNMEEIIENIDGNKMYLFIDCFGDITKWEWYVKIKLKQHLSRNGGKTSSNKCYLVL